MAGPADAGMRGIFPILVTPFDERERVDEDGLRAVVEFNLSAGVHGLGIALASEIGKLTEAERERVIEVVVEQVRGRVPVVVNSGRPGQLHRRPVQPAGGAARRGGGDVPAPRARLGGRDPGLLQGRLGRRPRAGLHPGHAGDAGPGRADPAHRRRERAGALRQGGERAAGVPGAGGGRGGRGAGARLRRRRRDLPARGAAPRRGRDDALAEPAGRLRRHLGSLAVRRRARGERTPRAGGRAPGPARRRRAPPGPRHPQGAAAPAGGHPQRRPAGARRSPGRADPARARRALRAAGNWPGAGRERSAEREGER